MPMISIKGTTGATKSKRVGNTIVVEKTIEKGLLKETHQEPGRRVTGKQSAKELITLSAKDIKALTRDAEGKGKEATKKQLMNMNLAANRAMEKMGGSSSSRAEDSHRPISKGN